MHPGPSKGRVNGELPQAPWRLGAPPVEYFPKNIFNF